MSLITTSSNGQNPSQYSAKFPSGSVVIPRNGQIAFYNGIINYNQTYQINENNDTLAVFVGTGGETLSLYDSGGTQTNSDKQWEFIHPQYIKIPHGTYQGRQTQNQVGAVQNNNKENATGDLGAEICKQLNTNIIFRSWKFSPTYDANGRLSIKGYQVTKDGANTDLILLERYGTKDNGGSTIVQNEAAPQTPATFMSVAGSSLAISQHTMMFPANLNNVGASGSPTIEYVVQADINIPLGQDNRGWVGSFIGLAPRRAWDLENPDDEMRAVREGEIDNNGNVLNYIPGNLPVYIRIHDDGSPQPKIEALVYDIDDEGFVSKDTVDIFYTNTPASDLIASNNNPTSIGIAAKPHTSGTYRLQFYVLSNGNPQVKTTLTNGSGDNFYELDATDAKKWFSAGEEYKLVVHRSQNVATQSLTISGRDDHIGRGAPDATLDLVDDSAPLPDGAVSVMLVTSKLGTNQIIDGGVDRTGNDNPVSFNATDKAVEISEICNATWFDNDVIGANNRTGGSNYVRMIGADSADDNGKAIVGELQLEDKRYSVKINLDNLQLKSVHGDLLNGNMNNTLWAGSFKMDEGSDNTSANLEASPQLVYIDCNNREEIPLDRLEISIRDSDNNIYQNLVGNTLLNFLVREKEFNIIREKRNDILKEDNTEENIKLSN